MKSEEEYTMYGEYADIVSVVTGGLADSECIPYQDLDSDFDFGLAHVEEGNAAQYRLPLGSNRVISDVMHYNNVDPVILVLGQPPFHVEYVSTTWANQFGWSSEEIMGLDLRFFQGDGAIGINVRTLYDVAYTEKSKSVEVTGYHKNGKMFTSTVIFSPIYDVENVNFSRVLSNIAIKFKNTKFFGDFPSTLLELGSLNEIGMPLDRREYSASYRLRTTAPAVGNRSSASGEFLAASRIIAQKPLSDVVRFMSTSETSIGVALADRYGRLVSINESFSNLFGVKIKNIEGKNFDFLFNELTDSYTRDRFPSSGNLTQVNPFETPILISKENAKYSEEFTAVLYNKSYKTITCRVVILPVVITSLDVRQPAAIHFGVVIQKLFIEEMCMYGNKFITSHKRKPLDEEANPPATVMMMAPFRSPEKFPPRLPFVDDNFSWD